MSVRPGDYALLSSSPPCQAYSAATPVGRRGDHPDLVAVVRSELCRIGCPYVIENVPGAPMLHPLLLCGMMFDLKVFRHRLFDTSHLLLTPQHSSHSGERIGVNGFCTVAGGGNSGRRDRATGKYIRCRPEDGVNGWRRAMQIDWMTRDELAQAIPPAYTRWIGEQMMAVMR